MDIKEANRIKNSSPKVELIHHPKYGKLCLGAPSWDCDWYWGWGYLSNKDCFLHVIPSLTVEQFMEYLNPKYYKIKWDLYELLKTFYILKEYAEFVGRGNAYISGKPLLTNMMKDTEYARKINEVLLPQVFYKFYDLIRDAEREFLEKKIIEDLSKSKVELFYIDNRIYSLLPPVLTNKEGRYTNHIWEFWELECPYEENGKVIDYDYESIESKEEFDTLLLSKYKHKKDQLAYLYEEIEKLRLYTLKITDTEYNEEIYKQMPHYVVESVVKNTNKIIEKKIKEFYELLYAD